MRFRRTCALVAFLGLAVSTGAFAKLRPTGTPVRVSPEGEALAHPVWGPDGRWIAATRPNYRGIWLVAADGSGTKQLTDALGAGFDMSWSPDGRAILCRVTRERDDKRREHAVQVIDVATGRARLLTRWRKRISDVPHWLGNNQVVLFSAGKLEAWTLRSDGKVEALSRVPERAFYAKGGAIFRAGSPEPIFRVDGEGYVLNLRPSPDGQLLAFEISGGDLYVVSADGKSVIDLGPGNRPRWSPDSQWIVFFVARDDGHRYLSSDLYAVRPDGSERVQLTRTEGALEMDPCWAPDGRRVAFHDYKTNAIYVLDVSTK
ncbi:MAG: hypothetical protein GXO73_02360 [Calditrichaeota bacterium]|nr:hypothetical protein [Calditrichota bacterium]